MCGIIFLNPRPDIETEFLGEISEPDVNMLTTTIMVPTIMVPNVKINWNSEKCFFFLNTKNYINEYKI